MSIFFDKVFVFFVFVDNMMWLVNYVGIFEMLCGLIVYIEEDFCCWELFDKILCVVSYFDVGVIELMFISDGEVYGFKYVNGYLKNMLEGL